MTNRVLSPRRLVGCLLLSGLLWGGPVTAQDVMSVATVNLSAPGEVEQIPIYLRDSSATALGADIGSGQTIQSFALRVAVSPAAAVASLSLSRSGVTALPAPRFETQNQNANVAYAVLSFDELSDPVQFASDAPFPGQRIAILQLEVAKSFVEGRVTITLLPNLTALSNQAGWITETVGNGELQLVAGTVLVSPFGLFVDGFESGSTATWSTTFP